MPKLNQGHGNVTRFVNFNSSTIGELVIYTTLLFEDNFVSCNCPGWTFQKKGKERSCKHTKMITGQKRMEYSLMASTHQETPVFIPSGVDASNVISDGMREIKRCLWWTVFEMVSHYRRAR